jgi:hypothetical protein
MHCMQLAKVALTALTPHGLQQAVGSSAVLHVLHPS